MPRFCPRHLATQRPVPGLTLRVLGPCRPLVWTTARLGLCVWRLSQATLHSWNFFCGSAGLAAEMRQLAFQVLGVDNKPTPKHACTSYQLGFCGTLVARNPAGALQSGWRLPVAHLLRGTTWFHHLASNSQACWHELHSCMYGSARRKRTGLLSMVRLPGLMRTCDGSHTHKAWGRTRAADGWKFATAEKTAYPPGLCQAAARD